MRRYNALLSFHIPECVNLFLNNRQLVLSVPQIFPRKQNATGKKHFMHSVRCMHNSYTGLYWIKCGSNSYDVRFIAVFRFFLLHPVPFFPINIALLPPLSQIPRIGVDIYCWKMDSAVKVKGAACCCYWSVQRLWGKTIISLFSSAVLLCCASRWHKMDGCRGIYVTSISQCVRPKQKKSAWLCFWEWRQHSQTY